MRRKTKNIAISLENYDKLLKIASKSETWDDIIGRVTDYYIQHQKRNEMGARKSKAD
jgi:predicted CopG family antitoxin